MHKSIARKLAGVLAAVVLTTTFASDYNSIGVRASEIEATETLTSENEAEVVEADPAEEEESFVETEETEEVEETSEETEEVVEEQPEEVAEEVTEEVSEELATEEATEVTEDQTPSEEVTGEAGEETPAEEVAEPEAAPTEEAPAENAEVKNITYVAGEGGSVSIESEQVVDVAAGATAIADEGFKFVNWTGSDESILSDSETFVPAGDVLVDGAVFTANFSKIIEKEFTASETIDGIKIDLYANPGVLPADAKLEVTKVSEELEDDIKDAIDEETGDDVNVKQTFSFDINIKSGDEYVQPEDGTVEVRFSQIEEAKSEDTSLAVYHVEDDLSNVKEVAKEVESTDGEISFDAEHFSIYTVTLYEYNENAHQIKISVVDTNGNSIGTVSSLGLWLSDNSYKYADTIAKEFNISGYTFEKATIKGKEFTYFYLSKQKIRFAKGDKYVGEDKAEDVKEGDIKFIFSKNVVKTSLHIDVEFTNSEVYKAYTNHKAKVSVNYDNKWHEMDDTDNGDGNQCRLNLKGKEVKATDTISFKVEFNGQVYEKTTTTEENEAAYQACYTRHQDIQDEFGFDYLFKFPDDFTLKSDVVYHANFDGAVVSTYGQTKDKKNKVKIKSYTDTKMSDNEGAEFKGWSTDPNATEADEKYKVGKEVKVDNKLDLYAVWASKNIPVAVYATDGGKTVNNKVEDTLGLKFRQTDNYYPVGVIYLPASVFKGQSPYINSEDDFKAIINSVSGIDTSYLVGEGTKNKNNKVYEFIKAALFDQGQVAGSLKTALFDWSGKEYADAIQHPDGKDKFFKYHLDLRFSTNKVNYKFVYPNKSVKDANEVVYLTSSTTTLPDKSDVTLADTNYTIDGFYKDKDCKKQYAEVEKKIKEDETIYVKLVANEANYTVKYVEEGNTTNQLKNSVTRSGKVGTTAEPTNDDKKDITTKDGIVYTYAGDGTATIKADGSAVVYVYFKKTAAKYTVEYFLQDAYGQYPEKASVVENGTKKVYVGQKLKEDPKKDITVGGIKYAFDDKHKNNKTEIKKVDKDAKKNVITLYYKRNDGEGVGFFVLLPGKQVPNDSTGQNASNYFPHESKWDWPGKAVDLKKGVASTDKDTNGNVWDLSGAKVTKYIKSYPDSTKVNKYFSDNNIYVVDKKGSRLATINDIVWYVYKDADSSEKVNLHIDGYVKGANVKVTYHSNYGEDKTYVDDSHRSGETYQVKNYSENMFAAKPGCEFDHWYTIVDGKRVDIKMPYSHILMSDVDLYAEWKAVDYTTTYYDEDGKKVLGKNTEVKPPVRQQYGDDTWTMAKDPEKKDHIFTGWIKRGDKTKTKLTTEQIKNTKVEGNSEFIATFEQTVFKAYYRVDYYYQKKNGNWNSKGDVKSDLIEVEVDTQKNDGKVEVSVTDDDKAKTEYKKTTFTLLDAGEANEWSGFVTKDNTKKNPLVLKVKFVRDYIGIKITINTESDSKIYDGTELTKDAFTWSATGRDAEGNEVDLKNRFEVNATATGKIEGKGKTANKLGSFEIKDTLTEQRYVYNIKGETKTTDMVYVFRKGESACIENEPFAVNYIVVNEGTLTVTPRTIKITVPGLEKLYDGVAVTSEDFANSEVKVEAVFTEEEIAAGKTMNLSVRTDKNAFKFSKKSFKTVADGKESLEDVMLDPKSRGTKKGWELQLNGKDIKDKHYDNYVIEYVNGDIIINPRKVTITSASGKAPYDIYSTLTTKALLEADKLVDDEGNKLDSEIIVSFPENQEYAFVEGEEPEYNVTGSQYEEGSSANTFTYMFSDDKAVDEEITRGKISENYEITVVEGTLTVTPRGDDEKYKITIELTTDKEENGRDTYVKYSGVTMSAKMDVNVTVNVDSEKIKEAAKNYGLHAALNSIQDAIESVISAAVIKASADDSTPGVVEIAEQKITVDEELGWYIVVGGMYLTGGAGKNVGDYPILLHEGKFFVDLHMGEKTESIGNNFTIEIIKDGNAVKSALLGDGENEVPQTEDEQPEFVDVTEVIGYLHVLPREVSLTSPSATKVYDGTPLTAKDITVGGDGFAPGEGYDFDVIGTITDPGTVDNLFTKKPSNAETVDTNYKFEESYGTLTVVKNTDTDKDDDDDDDDDDDKPSRNTNTNNDNNNNDGGSNNDNGSVLGVTRPVEEVAVAEGEVLGARRGGTEDTTNPARMLVLLFAAGAAVTLMALGKRKKQEEE